VFSEVARQWLTRSGSGVCIAAVEDDLPDQLLDYLIGEREQLVGNF
jgi:hypothetical protein